MKKQLLAVLSATVVGGCAFLDANQDFKRAQSESNPAGVKGLLRGSELRFLSTADLVRSFVPGATEPALLLEGPTSNRDRAAHLAAQVAEQRATDRAVAEFYRYYLTGSDDQPAAPVTGALLRNEIQDRILAAANQRCHLWKNYYSTASSSVGFISGITAATSNAAAVAFSPESTKDALTALSSTATAIGTNYDKSYLFGLTLGVIYQGVDSRRAGILESILGKRVTNNQVTPLGSYTLSAAIEDALEYHGACSVASGAQEAAERISDARKPEPAAEPKGRAPEQSENQKQDDTTSEADGDSKVDSTDGDDDSRGQDEGAVQNKSVESQQLSLPAPTASDVWSRSRTASPASVAPPNFIAVVPESEAKGGSVHSPGLSEKQLEPDSNKPK